MKSIWQIELAEEENSRNQHDEMTARTLGCSKIQDIAFKSRENKQGDFFPIGSISHFVGSLISRAKKAALFTACPKNPRESRFVILANRHDLGGHNGA